MQVLFRTDQLEHDFGFPFQLGHHKYASSPADADLATISVRHGDILVMGSDGLFDNVDNSEIINEVHLKHKWSVYIANLLPSVMLPFCCFLV